MSSISRYEYEHFNSPHIHSVAAVTITIKQMLHAWIVDHITIGEVHWNRSWATASIGGSDLHFHWWKFSLLITDHEPEEESGLVWSPRQGCLDRDPNQWATPTIILFNFDQLWKISAGRQVIHSILAFIAFHIDTSQIFESSLVFMLSVQLMLSGRVSKHSCE